MNDPRAMPLQFGVPVNFETGQPLTERQINAIARISECGQALSDAMHDAEGSATTNEGFQSRRMAIAGTNLEICLMMARKAAVEVK